MDVTGSAWRTSTYSGSNGGACVEIGTAGSAVVVRDSKRPDGPLLAFPADTWRVFANQVKRAPEPGVQPGTPECPFARQSCLAVCQEPVARRCAALAGRLTYSRS